MAALELAKARVLRLESVMWLDHLFRITDAGSYTHAGPEIGVASTKAFTAQVTVLTLMAIFSAKERKAERDNI